MYIKYKTYRKILFIDLKIIKGGFIVDKILVPVDGSENSDRALIKAKELATSCESSITILHIIEDLVSPGLFRIDGTSGYDVLLQKELERDSIALLDSCKKNLKDFCGKVETVTKSGNPAQEIMEIAEKGGYDLIIIGSRGLGAVPGAMLGSVSNKIVNKSTVDVLTVQ